MTVLNEINDRLMEWQKPSGFSYEARLYIDLKRDTATAYVKINDDYEIRFGFIDPYKKNLSKDDECAAVAAILRETGQPVADVECSLFCPVDSVSELWQLNIYYENETSDVIFLHPTGKNNDLVATTDVVNILDLLKEPKKQKTAENNTTMLKDIIGNLK